LLVGYALWPGYRTEKAPEQVAWNSSSADKQGEKEAKQQGLPQQIPPGQTEGKGTDSLTATDQPPKVGDVGNGVLRDRRVLVVCHQVVVLCFRYVLERMTEPQILAIDAAVDLANCSLTAYERAGDRLELRRFNFVAPLLEEGAPVTTEPDVPVEPK